MVTIVVEDGTGLSNANSYVSLAEADTYFADQGTAGASWAAPDALKSEYLVRAAAGLDATFGPRFMSELEREATQALLFPRRQFWDRHYRRFDFGEIPQSLKNAQMEMALLASQGVDLYPEGRVANNLLSESVTIGEISQSFTYQRTPEEQATYDGFRKVEQILWPILKPKTQRMKFRL